MRLKRLSPLKNHHAEEEEEEVEEDEEADEGKKSSSIKKPPAKPVASTTQIAGSNPYAQSSDDEEDGNESGSESGSDSDPSPETPPHARTADPTIKFISSKPMDEAPKSKKPTGKPSSATISSSPQTRSRGLVKHPGEPDKDGSKDSKRRKKKEAVDEEEEAGVPEEAEKKPSEPKQLFQRLWSPNDEIAILKGMLDYHSKKGTDPSTDMKAFHGFIKKSLHVDASKSQLADKVKRLRKKYVNNAARGKKRKSLHEYKAFLLSKKVFGTANNVPSDQTVSKGKMGISGKAKATLQSKATQLA